MVNNNINNLISLAEHSLRLKLLAEEFCKYLNITNNTKENLIAAAFLHDIGKLKISSKVLSKKTKLTLKEYKHIQRHVKYTYYLIKKLNVKEEICAIVLQHHENFNGTGYPKGLKGKEISFEARILRILDVYDALTSDRPYRNKLSAEQTLETMSQEIEMFDSSLFLKFKDMIENRDYIVAS